ncbi:MAG TPA: flagellar motor switch protein FliM [Candidatus Methylacidiphilales bacterium]|nr:flagellar motor switch protein FliM [Candidatus Methylacidiphilales bacterium]
MATLDANETVTEAGAPTADERASAPFRFSAPTPLTPARQESLEAWHRNFVRTASGILTDLLRFEVQLELESMQAQSYGQLVEERGEENQCLLFRMQPQPGIWLLDLPLSLALLLVERMMGGSGAAAKGNARELTELEQVVFQQFAETLLADYAGAWSPHAELRPDVVRQVRNLKTVRNFSRQQIHQPEDLMLKFAVQVTIKDIKSTLTIVVPAASVEDVLIRSGAPAANAQEQSPVIKDKNSPMAAVPVPISIRWQGFQMTLREVESMAPGDILVLDNKKCENAAIWLGDRAKFSGRLVREPQKTTVTIIGNLE